jgi:hypothetical protein
MIDVRSAKTGHDRKKDPSLDFSKDVYFACQAYPALDGCGPSAGSQD